MYSEVCATDVHLWHGRLANVPYPIIPGHVSVGTLKKVRGTIVGINGNRLAEGDRVVFFDVHRTCGRCRACTVWGTPTRCAARRVYGITDSAADGLFGGWAQAIYLEPGVSVARLPPSVEPESYIGGGCGLLTAVHIIDRAGIMLGDTVAVQDTGAVGLSAVALARLVGDRYRCPGRPAGPCPTDGADAVIDIVGMSPAERHARVLELTEGDGVDIAIEAAGSARAVEEGLDLVRHGGRYVIAGHYTDAGASAVNAHHQINKKHLEIRGSWGSEVGHFLRALRLLAGRAAHLPWREIGARTFRLDELDDALADAEAHRVPKALVKPN